MTDDFRVIKRPRYWNWAEAFWKFGFGDGIDSAYTQAVQTVLAKAGYNVELYEWGSHNTVIASISKDGVEQIPHERVDFEFGYDHPRGYLPAHIIELLDVSFPAPGQLKDFHDLAFPFPG